MAKIDLKKYSVISGFGTKVNEFEQKKSESKTIFNIKVARNCPEKEYIPVCNVVLKYVIKIYYMYCWIIIDLL